MKTNTQCTATTTTPKNMSFNTTATQQYGAGHEVPATPSPQSFLTITRDNAKASYTVDIVHAASAQEAKGMAVEAQNMKQGYGPHDDGGFEAVTAQGQDELSYLLAAMSAGVCTI